MHRRAERVRGLQAAGQWREGKSKTSPPPFHLRLRTRGSRRGRHSLAPLSSPRVHTLEQTRAWWRSRSPTADNTGGDARPRVDAAALDSALKEATGKCRARRVLPLFELDAFVEGPYAQADYIRVPATGEYTYLDMKAKRDAVLNATEYAHEEASWARRYRMGPFTHKNDDRHDAMIGS